MSQQQAASELHIRLQRLKSLFIDHDDARKVSRRVADIVGDFLAAQQLDLTAEVRGLAVLGNSGTGKTASVLEALSQIGMRRTRVGDNPRPFLAVQLSADATLRRVCSDILLEYGWAPKTRDNTQRIWADIGTYVARLQTIVLVLDEIQHVRSAGSHDRAALRDFLKSLVQPRETQVIPIVVGMPEFEEVFNSDIQLRRRFDLVHMRTLDPATDLKLAIQTLDSLVNAAGLSLTTSVTSPEFASRLLHASEYAFGEMCAVNLRGIKRAIQGESSNVDIGHFAEAHRSRYDCVPARNPFVAANFQDIKIGDPNADTPW